MMQTHSRNCKVTRDALFRTCPGCYRKFATLNGWRNETQFGGSETREIKTHGDVTGVVRVEVRACPCGGRMVGPGVGNGSNPAAGRGPKLGRRVGTDTSLAPKR